MQDSGLYYCDLQVSGGGFSRKFMDPWKYDRIIRSDFNYNVWISLHGDDFAIDGVPVSGLGATMGSTLGVAVPFGSVLTGILADGSPIRVANDGDRQLFSNATIEVVRAVVDRTAVIDWNDGDHEYGGVHAGQTLNINSGVFPHRFIAGSGSAVNVNGGELGDFLDIESDAEVTLASGRIGSTLLIDGTLNVQGGEIPRNSSEGRVSQLRPGGVLNITGGVFRDYLYVNGGEVNVNGGGMNGALMDDGVARFGTGLNGLTARSSQVEITGGNFGGINGTNFGEYLDIEEGSAVRQSGGEANLRLEDDSSLVRSGGRGVILLKDTASAIVTGGEPRTMLQGTLIFLQHKVEVYDQSSAVISGGDFHSEPLNWPPGMFQRPDPGPQAVLSGPQTTVEIQGTSFSIDGTDITNTMVQGVPFTSAPATGLLVVNFLDGNILEADLKYIEGALNLVKVGASEIEVSGNGVEISGDGTHVANAADGTNFGAIEAASEPVMRTFTIANPGIEGLDLTGTPRVAVSGDAAFSISSQPATNVVAPAGRRLSQ